MELNEKDKERLLAEEKYRMEIRKDMMKERFGHWGRGGSCCGGGCGCGHRGGFFKLLFLGIALFAVLHCFHWCGGRFNSCNTNVPAVSAPSVDAPKVGK